jgi:hypothetical protein
MAQIYVIQIPNYKRQITKDKLQKTNSKKYAFIGIWDFKN